MGWRVVCALCTAALGAWAQSSFRVDVNLVQVEAMVVDGQGRAIGGLQRDDFEIYQDGKPQRISSFLYVTAAQTAPSPERRAPLVMPIPHSGVIRQEGLRSTAGQAESERPAGYYLLGYRPPDGTLINDLQQRKSHRIQLKVRRSGLRLSPAPPGNAPGAVAPPPALPPQVRAALGSAAVLGSSF